MTGLSQRLANGLPTDHRTLMVDEDAENDRMTEALMDNRDVRILLGR